MHYSNLSSMSSASTTNTQILYDLNCTNGFSRCRNFEEYEQRHAKIMEAWHQRFVGFVVFESSHGLQTFQDADTLKAMKIRMPNL